MPSTLKGQIILESTVFMCINKTTNHPFLVLLNVTGKENILEQKIMNNNEQAIPNNKNSKHTCSNVWVIWKEINMNNW